MGKHNIIKVGQKFTLNTGSIVEVVEYRGSKAVIVEFEDGSKITTTADALRKGNASGRQVFNEPVTIVVGNTYKTGNFGEVLLRHVFEDKKLCVIEFKNTGNIQICYVSQVRVGHVKDTLLVQQQKEVIDRADTEWKTIVEESKIAKENFRKTTQYKELVRKRMREYYTSDRERIIEKSLIYQKLNPDKCRVYNQNARGRRKSAEGSHTYEEIYDKLEDQDYKCVYCSADLFDEKHLDHIMPLALGGTNDINNLQWLCPTCNMRKSDKHPDEWLRIFNEENSKIAN